MQRPRALPQRMVRHKWDITDDHLDFHVRADGVNFGKFASGILLRASQGLSTTVDAMGDLSMNNAVKAMALANAFAAKEDSSSKARDCAAVSIAFVPRLVERKVDNPGEKNLKLVSCQIVPMSIQSLTLQQSQDFTRGGIYVPAARVSRSEGREGTASPTVNDNTTPTAVAKRIVNHWRLRFKTEGNSSSSKDPFLLARGSSSVACAVRALCFVCADLQEERLALQGLPGLVVQPLLWQRTPKRAAKEDAARVVTGKGGGAGVLAANAASGDSGRFVVLRLLSAP